MRLEARLCPWTSGRGIDLTEFGAGQSSNPAVSLVPGENKMVPLSTTPRGIAINMHPDEAATGLRLRIIDWYPSHTRQHLDLIVWRVARRPDANLDIESVQGDTTPFIAQEIDVVSHDLAPGSEVI